MSDLCAICGKPVEVGTGGRAVGPFPALHGACIRSATTGKPVITIRLCSMDFCMLEATWAVDIDEYRAFTCDQHQRDAQANLGDRAKYIDLRKGLN